MASHSIYFKSYLFLAILWSFAIPSYWCFFIRHYSGWCVRTSPNAFLSNERIKAWYLELTDDCNGADSQFRFANSGVLQHVSSSGCVLPLNGKLSPTVGTKLVVLYGQKDCLNETRHGYSQTIRGSLRHFSGKCVQPHTPFQSVPSVEAKLEYTATCNTTKQEFVFGSVTCEDTRTANTNCPSFQVIVITAANYGGYGHLQTCGYSRNYNCKLPSSQCEMKEKCEGLQSCEIKVETKEFQQDPCPGMPKYLYMEYNCLNKTKFKDNRFHISSIRLGSQTTSGEGDVEVIEKSNPNSWQKVCVRNWEEREKQVVCRNLGYSGYKQHLTIEPTTTSVPRHMSRVDIYCGGDNITSCCFQRITTGQSTQCSQQTRLACSICSEPILTRENSTLKVTFTASNAIPWYTADQAVMSSNRSWCGVRSGDYLELDLGEKHVISQLSTLGDLSRGQSVTSFLLYYAKEGATWKEAMTNGKKLFTSRSGSNAKLTSNIFNGSITARFLKIIPKTWSGQPCLRMEICGHKLLPDAPMNLTLLRVTAYGAVLSWMQQIENGDGAFTNYSVKVFTDEKLHLSYTTKNMQYSVVHLRPYTNYTVTIQAGNLYGYGHKIETTFMTNSAVPSGPPANIEVRAASATTLLIEWKPPLLHHRNGVLKGYEICLTQIPSSDECDRVVRTRHRVLRVSELKPASAYKVKILARNDAGFGNYSMEYFQVTNAEAPICNYSSVTEESFVVNLQRPREEVSVCQVVVIALPRDDHIHKTSLNFEKPVTYLESSADTSTPLAYIAAEFAVLDFHKHKTFTVGDEKLFPVLLKSVNSNNNVQKYFNGPLLANTRYTVVQKFYSNEKLLYLSDALPPVRTLAGNMSYEKQGKLKDPVPLGSSIKAKIKVESSTSLNITWFPPLSSMYGVILDYKVCIAHAHYSGNDCNQEIRTKATNAHACSLKPSTRYKVRVSARNKYGFGEYSRGYFRITNAEAPVCNMTNGVTKESFVVHLQEPRREITVCQVIVIRLHDDKRNVYPVRLQQTPASRSPSSYIAAEFNTLEFFSYKTFTVGNGQKTKALISKNNQTFEDYHNSPLTPNTKYTVIQKFYSGEVLRYSSDFLSPVRTMPNSSSAKLKDQQVCVNDNHKVPFIVVTIVLVSLVIITIILILLLRKQYDIADNARTSRIEQILDVQI